MGKALTNDQASYLQQHLRCPAGAPDSKNQVLQQAGARARAKLAARLKSEQGDFEGKMGLGASSAGDQFRIELGHLIEDYWRSENRISQIGRQKVKSQKDRISCKLMMNFA